MYVLPGSINLCIVYIYIAIYYRDQEEGYLVGPVLMNYIYFI